MTNDPGPASPQKTALLVEDEATTLYFYMNGLKGLHEFRLLSAQNGLEALEVLQANPVDVVVTDLNMPVLDGYGLIAILSQRYPSLPIIVITSVGDPALHTQALNLGALRVIPKPPKLSMLMETIRGAVAVKAEGFVRGLGLASILQLMNWERRSATLTVKGPKGTGYLYVQGGDLIHAALGREEGLMAAYMPLTEILMNVALFRDMKLIPDPPSEDLPDELWQS